MERDARARRAAAGYALAPHTHAVRPYMYYTPCTQGSDARLMLTRKFTIIHTSAVELYHFVLCVVFSDTTDSAARAHAMGRYATKLFMRRSIAPLARNSTCL